MAEMEEPPVAALASICGIQDRDEAEKLLAAANYDLQLCVYRMHQKQSQLRVGNALGDSGSVLARTDSSGHAQTLARMQTLHLCARAVRLPMSRLRASCVRVSRLCGPRDAEGA